MSPLQLLSATTKLSRVSSDEGQLRERKRRARYRALIDRQRGQAAGLAPLFAFSVVRLPSSAVILLDDEDVDCALVNLSYE